MQGSTLSALLCNLYLADLENAHIRPLLPAAAADGHQQSGVGSASAAGHLSGLAADAAEAGDAIRPSAGAAEESVPPPVVRPCHVS